MSGTGTSRKASAGKSRSITREMQGIVRGLVGGCDGAAASGPENAEQIVDMGLAVQAIREKRITELGCYLRAACMRCGLC